MAEVPGFQRKWTGPLPRAALWVPEVSRKLDRDLQKGQSWGPR